MVATLISFRIPLLWDRSLLLSSLPLLALSGKDAGVLFRWLLMTTDSDSGEKMVRVKIADDYILCTQSRVETD